MWICPSLLLAITTTVVAVIGCRTESVLATQRVAYIHYLTQWGVTSGHRPAAINVPACTSAR